MKNYVECRQVKLGISILNMGDRFIAEPENVDAPSEKVRVDLILAGEA
jgi:hypothetical protein